MPGEKAMPNDKGMSGDGMNDAMPGG
jgi:hypothetical protein